MSYFITGILILLTILFICIGLFYNYKYTKLIHHLTTMIQAAKDGDFKEKNFDESLLSSTETLFYDYITSAIITTTTIQSEKDTTKELLSDISHQTKTPIANILLYTELLEEMDLPSESKEYLIALKQQSEKLVFLIQSLIKTSRLETGTVSLFPTPNKIQDLFDKVSLEITPKCKQKNILLSINDTNISAFFDKKWTIEALYNIVDNAVKYTHQNGEITITVTPYDLFCKIDIKDNGIGIAENEQAQVFSRFYRSENVRDSEGVGIGLYLARQIIKDQDGYIKLTSSLNQGSTFSIFLPLASNS